MKRYLPSLVPLFLFYLVSFFDYLSSHTIINYLLIVIYQVLKLEKESVKALFRRGQANYYLKDFESAKQDLTLASKLEPNNNDVKKTLKQVTDQLTQQKEKEKAFYGKMFK